MLKLARRLGWWPAGWDGGSFNASKVALQLGPLALNDDGVVTLMSAAAKTARSKNWKTAFVRPDAETKEFSGQAISIHELESWAVKLASFGNLEDAVVVAEVKEIGREWRAFVVSGEVVSICQYSSAGDQRRTTQVPDNVQQFARNVLEVYQPAPCFVVDMTEVFCEDERRLRVVEYNSINSAGFYACDIGVIVEKLSRYVLSIST